MVQTGFPEGLNFLFAIITVAYSCRLSRAHTLINVALRKLRVTAMCSVQVTNDTLVGFGEPKIYGFDSGQQGLFQTAAECCAKCRKNVEVPHHSG